MNNTLATLGFWVLSGVIPLSTAIAQTCSKQSPPHTLALLELYTSEGCSSCPPADKFVSNLSSTGLTPDQVVPLSLHVDYWDYIGWKDPFGKRIFTERQRWLSDLANTRTIYTPEIFVAGREVRNWASSWQGGVAASVKRINAQPARADIGLSVGSVGSGSVPVEISVKAAQGGKLFVALYENGLATEVRSGENHGVTLKHDYVVRDWVGPIAVGDDMRNGRIHLKRALAVPGNAVAKNLGVAAFVQSDKGEILQALSLPLCKG